jgi:hypothetical protein
MLRGEATRKVDIAHSRQTVPEAIEQLRVEIRNAQRAGEDALLVVHGYGASGVGGEIKAALATELPRLARLFNFRAYRHADVERVPESLYAHRRSLNLGSTLLVFRQIHRDRESRQDFRPSFRTLRSRVIVRAAGSGAEPETCRHVKRQLMFRGADGSTYECRQCGKTFLMPNQR